MTYERSTGTMNTLPIGSEVFTRDGDRLGKVKEIHGDAFKVDVAFQPDYWLSMHTVHTSTDDRVILTFDKEELGRYQLDEPIAARA